MITIRHNPYTEAELKELEYVLQYAFNRFMERNCGHYRCSECPKRHVCYDLESALEYLQKNNRNGEG